MNSQHAPSAAPWRKSRAFAPLEISQPPCPTSYTRRVGPSFFFSPRYTHTHKYSQAAHTHFTVHTERARCSPEIDLNFEAERAISANAIAVGGAQTSAIKTFSYIPSSRSASSRAKKRERAGTGEENRERSCLPRSRLYYLFCSPPLLFLCFLIPVRSLVRSLPPTLFFLCCPYTCFLVLGPRSIYYFAWGHSERLIGTIPRGGSS